jgi:hypothetical protein
LLLLTAAPIGSLGGGAAPHAASVVSEIDATRIPAPLPAGIRGTSVTQRWASRNWSGYAVTGASYKSVSGTWTVPTVTGGSKRKTVEYSSTWVGIDGFLRHDYNLIQAGTEQDWVHGTAYYQAWWEILPSYETPITSIPVHPGDTMSVSISQVGSHWTILVSDVTTGQSFTTNQSYQGALSSAEWIQEAPTVGRHVASLADYGTVDFTQVAANGADPDLVNSDSGVMEKRSGAVISTPSAPDAAGNGFAVAYGSVPPPAP